MFLVAVFAIAAMSASSALAVKNPTNSLKIFQNCPFGVLTPGEHGREPTVNELCVFGATEKSPEGGEFTVGPITVPFSRQVQLQLGTSHFLTGEEEVLAPVDGAGFIVPTPELVPGEPMAHISEAEQNEEGWPVALKYSYAQAQKHAKLKKIYESIEPAGVPHVNTLNILIEEGVGVEAPVKVKGENAWISSVGDVCYIGSEEDPITQHLTTGASVSPLTGETIHGAAGELTSPEKTDGNEVIEAHSNLVDNTYAVPGVACTGPYSSYIEAAIDHVFGIPAAAGASNTQLKGTLYVAVSTWVQEKLHL